MIRDPEAIGENVPLPMVPDRKRLLPTRGYSLLELAHAGLTEADAARLGIPVDAQRPSMIGSNVMQLRQRDSASGPARSL